MSQFQDQTIAKRLQVIARLATMSSVIVILILTVGFGVLFYMKDHQVKAGEILQHVESASGNMGGVNVTMQSYLLSPDETGIWDEKDAYQSSAISFLTLAQELSFDKSMNDSIQELVGTIRDRLAPLQDQFEKLVKSDPAKAKEFYLQTYSPEMTLFEGKINLARSRADDIDKKFNRAIGTTIYVISCLVFGLLIINGLLLVRKTKLVVNSSAQLLENVCSGLVKNAKAVQTASHQVENSSATLAQAAGEQATSQQETAASIEEILQILTRNSQHAATNLEICQNGQQETVHGKKVVEALKAAMEDFQNLNSRLENLIQIINDIDAKTNIINDIAFQTRILSFNASVEAARSGEHGKGFAVVAEEVGKLSTMSKDAAEEIKLLISSSGKAVTEAVRMTQEKIGSTREISGKATELFDLFYRVMGQIGTATEQMMTSAMEQQTGMEQIRTTMVEVSNATEVTSENSERLLSYARGLATESESMRTLVHQLSLLVVERTSEGGDLLFMPSNEGTPPPHEASVAN